MERMTPLLLQIPGIKPTWLAQKMVDVIDANIDLSDAYLDGIPSIQAMNGMIGPGTGDPATDPAAQGDQGGQNNPAGPQRPGGPQPGMPDGGVPGSTT